jgi:hypothetical protein
MVCIFENFDHPLFPNLNHRKFPILEKAPRKTTFRILCNEELSEDSVLLELESFVIRVRLALHFLIKQCEAKGLEIRNLSVSPIVGIEHAFSLVLDVCQVSTESDFENSTVATFYVMSEVIVDARCATSVLRGADVYFPGLIGVSGKGKSLNTKKLIN